MVADVFGLTYLIGLLYNGVSSSVCLARICRERDERYSIIALVGSVAVTAFFWPVAPLIVAYLQKGGD